MIDPVLIYLLELLLAVGIVGLVTGVAYLFAMSRQRKSIYIERIRQLERQLELSNNLLDETKERCNREIQRLTGLAGPGKALLAALESGAVEVRHIDDGGKVIVLPDGTLVCDKGHVVNAGGGDGPGEHGVDAG